jgi:hypothetical protein
LLMLGNSISIFVSLVVSTVSISSDKTAVRGQRHTSPVEPH